MKQYQRHIEIATKLANAGNYDLAFTNIEALIRSARSNKAKAYLNRVIRDLIRLKPTPKGLIETALGAFDRREAKQIK